MRFDEHCLLLKKNPKRMRDVFQHQGFLTDLKLKARLCTFNELGDSMICDQIVFGTNDKKMKQKLLQLLQALTLGNTGRMCQAGELAKQHEASETPHMEQPVTWRGFGRYFSTRKAPSSDTRTARSFTVQSDDGQVFRRNRVALDSGAWSHAGGADQSKFRQTH